MPPLTPLGTKGQGRVSRGTRSRRPTSQEAAQDTPSTVEVEGQKFFSLSRDHSVGRSQHAYVFSHAWHALPRVSAVWTARPGPAQHSPPAGLRRLLGQTGRAAGADLPGAAFPAPHTCRLSPAAPSRPVGVRTRLCSPAVSGGARGKPRAWGRLRAVAGV